MFYDIYIALCSEKGVSPTKAALEMGLSKSTPTTWKKRGLTPQGETLAKIAEYFGVSTDYLLGQGTEKAPAPKSEGEVTFDDFTYAMYEETKGLPPEKKQMLLEMARLMRADMEREQK